MSILLSYPKRSVRDFYGVNSRAEASNVGPPFGLVARNVDYLPQTVKTRYGFYQEDMDLGLTGIGQFYGWFRPGAGKTQLAWVGFNGSGHGEIRTGAYDAGASTLVENSGLAAYTTASFLDWAELLYYVFLDSSQTSGTAMKYWDFGTGAAHIASRSPLMTSEFSIGAAAAPLASGMSAGTRNYAVVFQTKSGYLTKASPVTTAAPYTGVYYSFANAANDGVTVTITPTTVWPDDIVGAYLLVTTTTNFARLFWAPISKVTITPGAATPAVFAQLKVADGIIAQQRDALDQEGLWHASPVGNPAFSPRMMFAMGARAVYLLTRTNNGDIGPGVVFSDINQPETYAVDRNLRYLLKKQEPVTGFYHQGVAYILGNNFTQAFNDTGGYPVTWPNPRQISGKIGTSHINGVYVDPSGIGLVAHQSGLYVFSNGAYQDLPLSYYQKTQWEAILWPTPGGIHYPFQIGEDRANQKIYVLCTTAGGSKIYMWDYSAGLTPAKVKFSEWDITGEVLRGLLVAQNFGDAVSSGSRNQLWLAPNDGGPVWRHKPASHATPYTDEGARIDSRYRGPYMPEIDTQFLVNYHPGTEIRALGQGNLTGIAYGYDDVLQQSLAAIALAASPGVVYTRLMDLRNERASIEWRNGANAGDWFQISGWDQYYTGATKHR